MNYSTLVSSVAFDPGDWRSCNFIRQRITSVQADLQPIVPRERVRANKFSNLDVVCTKSVFISRPKNILSELGEQV